MGGSISGGRKAARTIKSRDPNFYKRIGAIGGKRGKTGGFAAYLACECSAFESVHHNAMCAGKLGGMKSKRRAKPTGGR